MQDGNDDLSVPLGPRCNRRRQVVTLTPRSRLYGPQRILIFRGAPAWRADKLAVSELPQHLRVCHRSHPRWVLSDLPEPRANKIKSANMHAFTCHQVTAPFTHTYTPHVHMHTRARAHTHTHMNKQTHARTHMHNTPG